MPGSDAPGVQRDTLFWRPRHFQARKVQSLGKLGFWQPRHFRAQMAVSFWAQTAVTNPKNNFKTEALCQNFVWTRRQSSSSSPHKNLFSVYLKTGKKFFVPQIKEKQKKRSIRLLVPNKRKNEKKALHPPFHYSTLAELQPVELFTTRSFRNGNAYATLFSRLSFF